MAAPPPTPTATPFQIEEDTAHQTKYTSLKWLCELFSVGDDVVIASHSTQPHLGRIERIYNKKVGGDNGTKVILRWYYTWENLGAINMKGVDCPPNELFFTFHFDEVPAEALLKKAKVIYSKKKPANKADFFCRYVSDSDRLFLLETSSLKNFSGEQKSDLQKLLEKVQEAVTSQNSFPPHTSESAKRRQETSSKIGTVSEADQLKVLVTTTFEGLLRKLLAAPPEASKIKTLVRTAETRLLDDIETVLLATDFEGNIEKPLTKRLKTSPSPFRPPSEPAPISDTNPILEAANVAEEKPMVLESIVSTNTEEGHRNGNSIGHQSPKAVSSWPDPDEEQRSEWSRDWDKSADDDRWLPSKHFEPSSSSKTSTTATPATIPVSPATSAVTQQSTSQQKNAASPSPSSSPSMSLIDQLNSVQLTRDTLEKLMTNNSFETLIKQFMVKISTGVKDNQQIYQIYEIIGTVTGKAYAVGQKETTVHLLLACGSKTHTGMIKNVSNQKFSAEEVKMWQQDSSVSLLQSSLVDSLIHRKARLV